MPKPEEKDQFRAWIEYKNGTRKRQSAPTAEAAAELEAQWKKEAEAAGTWHASGYALAATMADEDPPPQGPGGGPVGN